MISASEPADLEIPDCAACHCSVTIKESEQLQQSKNPTDAVRFVNTYADRTVAYCLCRTCYTTFANLDPKGRDAFRDAVWQRVNVGTLVPGAANVIN